MTVKYMNNSRIFDMLSPPMATPNTVIFDAVEDSELSKLRHENQELRQKVRELELTADTDPLLPVHNRRAFVREIERAQAVLDRYDIPSSVLYFDLNDFKQINDRHGHAIGDEVLRAVSDVLLNGVRDCDMVARLGGDEFGILLFKTDAEIASAKANVLAMRLSESRVKTPKGSISVSSAWGVAQCDTVQGADQIISRADRAMYLAKTDLHKRMPFTQ